MREVDKILNANEKVLWEGSPKFWPYFLTGFFPAFLFGVLILGIIGKITLAGSTTSDFWQAWDFPAAIMLTIFTIVGLLIAVGGPVYSLLVYKNIYYVITGKRVIIQGGIIGRSFEYIDFDKITNAEVSIGLWDRLVGKDSGSISISSASSLVIRKNGEQLTVPYVMTSIDNPYEVFKFFNQVEYDVKTDIEYPNQLRPTENPGYQTDYDPNKK